MKRLLLFAVTLVLTIGKGASAKPPPPPKATKAEILTAELFIAIRDHDHAGVKSALARGADPNKRNWLNFTPLMWAALRGEPPIVETLLKRGAERDAGSIFGSALTASTMFPDDRVAHFLLDSGIAPEPNRIDGITPLMLAASNNRVRLMERLLRQKSDPDRQNKEGATALMFAARLGQTDAVCCLLKAGANVHIADKQGRTALMAAAMNGYPKVVYLLLAHRAEVNAKDKKGATALLLACRYNGDAAVIRSLLQSGADFAVRDVSGQTAFSLALLRGYEEAKVELLRVGAESTSTPEPSTPTRAVEKGLAIIQSGMKGFAARARCTSCHHTGLGLMAVGMAAQHGFAVNRELIGAEMKKIAGEGQALSPAIQKARRDPHFAKTIPGVDIGDASIFLGYLNAGVIASKAPANPGLSEMALFLAKQQAADGHWGFGVARGPMQSSPWTTTALALRMLRAYGPQEKLASCYPRAKQWLLHTPVRNAEDRASRLLALTSLGVSAGEREQPLQELLAAQRADGGWTHAPSLRSDAYTTGMALYALKASGHKGNDMAFQRGVQFLLRTQDEDGSWYVNKRAISANTYFDAGFPHGESQYISFAATCWAIMALMEASEPSHTASLH